MMPNEDGSRTQDEWDVLKMAETDIRIEETYHTGVLRCSISFSLLPDELMKFREWRLGQLKKNKKLGCCGDRWKYTITPTTIGALLACTDLVLNETYEFEFNP